MLPVKIFISYSHHDAEYLGETSLLGYLKGLESESVEFWYDEKITTGDKWDRRIHTKIRESHIAVLLISESFLTSNYCVNEEIPLILKSNREKGLVVFPIMLSACEWERHPWLRSDQLLPSNGHTIEEDFNDKGKRKRLFLNIKEHLRQHIEAIRSQPTLPGAQKQTTTGELRQITVIHCRLALLDSDPSNLNALFDIWPRFQSRAEQVISRFDGYLGQVSGNDMRIYFGYPSAHDDDARRAVHAALAMIDETAAVNSLNESGSVPSIALHVGIHSGSVLVTKRDGAEALILGDALDLASRIEGECSHNAVVISDDTYELVENYFSCEFLDLKSFEGYNRKLKLYRVKNEAALDTAPMPVVRRLVPLIAREGELDLLLTRWDLAKESQGQVVLLRGDAGIGKTRLVRELRRQLTINVQNLLILRCSPYFRSSAFYIFANALNRLTETQDSSSQEERFQRLEEIVGRYELSIEEVAPLLESLLSWPSDDRYPPLNLSPGGQRRKTVQAFISIILGMAQKEPSLIIVEDLHWIDPSSLELLSILIESIPTARLLLILTYRPEFQPPWEQRAYLTQLTLAPLTGRQMEEMISGLSKGISLSDRSIEQIMMSADGVPLYVEELTKRAVSSSKENPTASGEDIQPPSTLQSSLTATLDQLGPAKKVAQIASVLGREFSYRMLLAVSSLDDALLKNELDRLVDAELLYPRETQTETRYTFKHALIRDAAYHSMIDREKASLHLVICKAIEKLHPDTVENRPELLAHHYTQTEFKEKAIYYWQLAGEVAIKRSANKEAISHLDKGAELLKFITSSHKSMRLELQIQMARGQALIASEGYGSQQVEAAYSRAWELCQDVGEDKDRIRVLRGLWAFLTVRAELRKAFDAATRLLTFADNEQDAALQLEAYRVLGSTHMYLGELLDAKKYIEKAMSLYDARLHRSHTVTYGQEPGACCLANESFTLWLLGYPDSALKKAKQAVTLARESRHPYSLAYTLFFSAWVYLFRGDIDAVRERVDEIRSLSQEQAFAFWAAMSKILDGWLVCREGNLEEGIESMERGLEAWQATGAELYVPSYLTLLAGFYLQAGNLDKSTYTLKLAHQATLRSRESYYEAEIHRLRGELSIAQSEQNGEVNPDAEQHFRQALELARKQKSKSLELRAGMSLGIVLYDKGCRDEAREMITQIYSWFDEGNDTADLEATRALIEKLSEGS